MAVYRALLFALLSTWAISSATADSRRLEYGLDRSNLVWLPTETQRDLIAEIASLKVAWFRDELSSAGSGNYAPFVEELKLAKAQSLKFLAVVNPAAEDFPPGYKAPNAGPDFAKRCGWPSGSKEISKIDLPRFQARLRAEFDAVKAAGLTIDAFEIGNEYDWICFNGDVPDGHEANQEELERLISSYAHFLKAAATTIHDPSYFPDAAIITFGMAHATENFDVGHHISNPDRILIALRHLDGVNYLDNAAYRISGVGLHLYPSADAKPEALQAVILDDSRAAGNLPVWITEWGYNRKAFEMQKDITRADAIDRFYDMLETAPAPLGPNFFYAISEPTNSGLSLIDQDGQEFPEAKELSRRAAQP